MTELMRRRRALLAANAGGFEHGTWEDLFYHIGKGDYSAEYSVGEILPLDLSAEGVVNAQIVAFNADAIPNSTDKAPITLVAEKPCNTTQRWNPEQSASAAPYIDGKGGVGGWEKSEIRAHVKNSILPLIPANIARRILSVQKVSTSFNTDGTKTDITTTDNLWIPSLREMFVSNTRGESSGVHYIFFDDKDNRKKTAACWLRTAYNHKRVEATLNSGQYGSAGNDSQLLLTVLIGFCIG